MQMDEVTQQNAALVEEMAAAANSLADQASALVRTVAVFKLGAAGERAASAVDGMGAGRSDSPRGGDSRPGGAAGVEVWTTCD